MKTYQYGNAITLSVEFRDDLDQYADPPEVKLSVMNPNGVLTTYTYGEGATIIKQDTGQYEADILGDIAGVWYYRWFNTQPDEISKEVYFEIIRVRTV